MMGIYVNGIEMPKEPDEMIELAIFGDGKTLKTGESWRSPVDGKCYYGTSEDMNTYSAFAVPPHGRLIDADAALKLLRNLGSRDYRRKKGTIMDAMKMLSYDEYTPTIIEAEEDE